MPVDDDVNQFIQWSAALGIPMNKMPDQNSMRSLFKNSRESAFFFSIMQKLRPQQEVELVRKNILVSKVNKLKDQIIPLNQRQFMPKEMQRYYRMQSLLEDKAKVDEKLKEAKEKCDLTKIKNKNMQKMKIIDKRGNLNTKVTILEIKLDNLSVKKQKELENHEKLLAIMPAKFNPLSSQEKIANNAIYQSITDLDEFYKISLYSSPNRNNIVDARTKLWEKLRNNFANIPNPILWNIINKMKEEQIQHLKDLNTNSHSFMSFKTQDILTDYDTELLKSKASILCLVSKYVKTLQDKKELDEKFTITSNYFVAAIRDKLSTFYNDNDTRSVDDIEELIADFVFQYNTRIYNKTKTDILVTEIEGYKTIAEEGRRNLEDHPVSITALKQIYSDTETLIQRVQLEISQLNEIKDKIKYSKDLLNRMLKDIQSSKQNSAESFDLDTILCSTKLDFDNTSISNFTLRSDNATMLNVNPIPVGTTPSILNELTLFSEIPIENFKLFLKPLSFFLHTNPIILESSDIGILKLCPNSILSAVGSLEKIKKQLECYTKLKNLSNELEPKIIIDQINFEDYKIGFRKQYEDITEAIDKIKICGTKTNRTLNKSHKYYEFILSNCLKNYIPNNKLFNNHTYADYESEYVMYSRMATIGSIEKK